MPNAELMASGTVSGSENAVRKPRSNVGVTRFELATSWSRTKAVSGSPSQSDKTLTDCAAPPPPAPSDVGETCAIRRPIGGEDGRGIPDTSHARAGVAKRKNPGNWAGFRKTDEGRWFVTCEKCRKEYQVTRARSDRPRHVCPTCKGKHNVQKKWETFITPAGSPEFKRDAAGMVNYRLKRVVPEFQIPTACQKCGEIPPKLDKHHPDYGKVFEVLFLCRPCHMKGHHRPGFLDGLVPVYIPTATEFAAPRSAVPA